MSEPDQPASSRPRSQGARPWLLALMLVSLIALLIIRDDLQRDAKSIATEAVIELLGLSSRESFAWRLRLSGLEDTDLGQRWLAAAKLAGQDAERFNRQFIAKRAFSPESTEAHAFQTTLQMGQSLVWQLRRTDASGGQLFAYLERRSSGSSGGWSEVAELASQAQGGIIEGTWFVEQGADFRIIIQPELLSSADYELTLATGGSLMIPVPGASQRDIGSPFGADRDGGARRHHGVDIFAARGTPVIAVAEGRVRTGISSRGGKHIWLFSGGLNPFSARYYYAHLDDFAVESGSRVEAGELIGYVGNTGNARTTPPHLHFGIYTTGGPVDPAPFIRPRPGLVRD